jgi:hypothetical protein
MRTGPTILTTSGVCVPGTSCAPGERVLFGPFVWANTPLPNSATKMLARQKTKAIKTRRLKKADFEVDFFFMDKVELFPSAVNPGGVFPCGEPWWSVALAVNPRR